MGTDLQTDYPVPDQREYVEMCLRDLVGLGDRPYRADWIMVWLSLTGIAFIVAMESARSGQAIATGPVGLAVFSGVMYAIVVLMIRRLRGVDVAWIGLVNHLATILFLGPLVIGRTPMPHGIQWLALAGLGALQFGLPYILFAWAVRNVESQEASIITLVEPLAVPIWTFLAWRHLDSYEYPRWWTLIGAALIAAGFVWRYGLHRRRSRSHNG